MLFIVNRKTKEVLLAKVAEKGEDWSVYNDEYDAIWVKGDSKDVDTYCTRKDDKLFLNFKYEDEK